MKGIIRSVGAYWRDDQPGGIGFTIDFPPDRSGNRFAQRCEAALTLFDRNPDALENALGLLTKLGREQHVPDREGLRAVATIHWLEQRGHLRSDDHNGIMWVATTDEAVVVVRLDGLTVDSARLVERYLPAIELRQEALDPGVFDRMLHDFLTDKRVD